MRNVLPPSVLELYRSANQSFININEHCYTALTHTEVQVLMLKGESEESLALYECETLVTMYK